MSSTDSRAKDSPQGAAAALLNGLRVLECFSAERPELGVTEITRLVDLHKSTVSRILSGLADQGYVERTLAGRYRLGLGVIALAAPLLAGLDVRSTALPHLEEAVERTGETAALLLRDGAQTIVVEQVSSPQFVRHTQNIGTRYHRWGSSSVRLSAAHMRTEVRDRCLASRTFTDGPDPSDPEALRIAIAGLARIRSQGFAVNDGDSETQEYGVSAPVRNVDGNLAAIITLSAPRQRVGDDLARTLTAVARDTAATVSTHLGYQVPRG